MGEREKREEREETAVEESAQDSTDKAAPEDHVSELEKLREELKAKEQEARENYDRFLRQLAELENFKKRVVREKEETLRYANESLVRDLLPVLDNLERAVDYARGGGNGKPILEGVEMVLKAFLEALNKHGVTQISAKGETFNPEKHEAIAQIETAHFEPNTVVEEHHKGYYLLDRLLRPSLVSVAKKPEDKEEKDKDGEVENGDSDD